MGWEIVIPVLAGGARSVLGWLENASKTGWEGFSLGKLFGTVIEVSVLSASAMFGLGLDPITASGVGVLGSFGLSALKKAGNAK